MSAGNGAATLLPTATASPPGATAPAPVGFVALRRFVVANGMAAEVKAAFRERRVDRAAGLIRMEVLSPFDRPQGIREFDVVCE